MSAEGAGLFVAVVGPSGAGKDTLIAAAKAALADDARFVFPRRLITRPADATEDAGEIGMADWEAAHAEGGFALSWRAHGIAYGIPAATIEAVAEGRVVVANVSRTVLDALSATYPAAAAIHVTATPETLARRLAERRREDEGARTARLARRTPDLPADLTRRTVANDGTRQDGIAAFLAALTDMAGLAVPVASAADARTPRAQDDRRRRY